MERKLRFCENPECGVFFRLTYPTQLFCCSKCERDFRKNYNGRRCQRVIHNGFYSEDERVCGKPVKKPNRYLCPRCLKEAESEEQACGYLN